MGTDPEFGSVPIYQGKFLDWATTPALRATPPVPGGEPESQTSEGLRP